MTAATRDTMPAAVNVAALQAMLCSVRRWSQRWQQAHDGRPGRLPPVRTVAGHGGELQGAWNVYRRREPIGGRTLLVH